MAKLEELRGVEASMRKKRRNILFLGQTSTNSQKLNYPCDPVRTQDWTTHRSGRRRHTLVIRKKDTEKNGGHARYSEGSFVD